MRWQLQVASPTIDAANEAAPPPWLPQMAQVFFDGLLS